MAEALVLSDAAAPARLAAGGESSPSQPEDAPGRQRLRNLLMLSFALAALVAMGVLLAWSPGESVAARLARYPYLPAPIIPGMSVAELTAAVAEQHLAFNPDSLDHGALRTGVVQAWSEDHKLNVFAWLEPDGSIRHVRFRTSASDALNQQLLTQSAEAYAAALWTNGGNASGQLTFSKDSRTVIVFSLFECDPVDPNEPNFANLDIRDTQVHPAGWWTSFLHRR